METEFLLLVLHAYLYLTSEVYAINADELVRSESVYSELS